MDSQDKRKRNLQWCSAQIDSIQERLKSGSGPASTTEDTFESFFPQALLALVAKEGFAITSWHSAGDSIQNIGSIWIAKMIAQGESPEDVMAFYDHILKLTEEYQLWLELRENRAKSRIGGGFGDEVPEPAPVSAPPETVSVAAAFNVEDRANPIPVDDPDEMPPPGFTG